MKITKTEVIQELSELSNELNTRPCDKLTLDKAIYLLGWLDDEVFEFNE